MKQIKTAITAAKAVAKAHIALKDAHKLEASAKAKLGLQKKLYEALEKLTDALVELDNTLASTPRTPKAPFDWHGLLRAADGFVGLVQKARGGKLDAKTTKDWIEGEVIEMKETPRRN
jgi:hypothetical protein